MGDGNQHEGRENQRRSRGMFPNTIYCALFLGDLSICVGFDRGNLDSPSHRRNCGRQCSKHGCCWSSLDTERQVVKRQDNTQEWGFRTPPADTENGNAGGEGGGRPSWNLFAFTFTSRAKMRYTKEALAAWKR